MLTIPGALPCCCANAPGRTTAIGDQTNIVIWNPQTQTEHFVRLAVFQSDAANFGFIAPSPTKPELAEVSPKAFRTLGNLKPQPYEVVQAKAAESAASMIGGLPVNVVQELNVAGYHATTVLARDSSALASWMNQNGYQSTPGIEEWTKLYIRKGWYLTAFKVLQGDLAATTGTIRMSFKTSQPFNPFYVPQDNIRPGQTGTLRLFFVSDCDYDGTIGQSEGWRTADWSASVTDQAATDLARELKLPVSALPSGAQVQFFQDPNFPRPASDDLYFTKSSHLL
ncbi:MAG TPA: DUF2330 domain-containing protein [Fimbriimonas sp.]|nr:DUF2330 domain-containing protein [Fimbriimonas sp.]